jgi:8-oxo-dGTP pyrophosphatase MutT (NUDIX family)
LEYNINVRDRNTIVKRDISVAVVNIMSESSYIKDIRAKIGKDLLLVPGVAAIIRNEKGQILAQKNTDGQWNLPAGGIDPGEKPAQAIVREVFEETGLIARPTRIVGLIGGGREYRIEYPGGDIIESTTTVFACEVIGGAIEPQDDETARLRYFHADDMPDLISNIPLKILADPDLSGFFEWDDCWTDVDA